MLVCRSILSKRILAHSCWLTRIQYSICFLVSTNLHIYRPYLLLLYCTGLLSTQYTSTLYSTYTAFSSSSLHALLVIYSDERDWLTQCQHPATVIGFHMFMGVLLEAQGLWCRVDFVYRQHSQAAVLCPGVRCTLRSSPNYPRSTSIINGMVVLLLCWLTTWSPYRVFDGHHVLD